MGKYMNRWFAWNFQYKKCYLAVKKNWVIDKFFDRSESFKRENIDGTSAAYPGKGSGKSQICRTGS